VGEERLDPLWIRGGFPRAFLAKSEADSLQWREAFIRTFLERQLPPWFANVKKRLVKSPKVYFRDTGIFHALLGIESGRDLLRHPKLGASWENFALEQVLALLRPSEAYFYAVHGSLELDLFLPGKTTLGVEFKRQDAPKVTRSMRQAIADLGLDMLWVVYPGSREIQVDDKILAKPLSRIQLE